MRRMWIAVVLVGTVLGCSKSKKAGDAKPAPEAAKPGAPEPAKPAEPKPAEPKPADTVPATGGAAAAPPCPAGEALKDKLAEVFHIKKDDIAQEPSCAAGHFPAAGWAVELWFTAQSPDGDTVTNDRFAILDAAGKVVSSTDDEIPPGAVDQSGVGGMQAVDFDGDGTDEVLSVFGSDRHGFETDHLNVQRLTAGNWESAMSRQFHFDNSAAVEGKSTSCEATWELTPAGADHTRTVVFTPKGKVPKSEDCVASKEIWALGKDGKLALIK